MVTTAEVALQSGGDHLNDGCGRYSIPSTANHECA